LAVFTKKLAPPPRELSPGEAAGQIHYFVDGAVRRQPRRAMAPETAGHPQHRRGQEQERGATSAKPNPVNPQGTMIGFHAGILAQARAGVLIDKLGGNIA